MLRLRPTLLLLLGTVVLYALLLLTWPVIEPVYGAAFRGSCGLLLGRPGDDTTATYERLVDSSRYADTQVIVSNWRAKTKYTTTVSARVLGFLPTALLIALVMATPIPWRRRCRTLLWALLIISAAVVARTFLHLAYELSNQPTLEVFQFGPIGRACLKTVSFALSISTLSAFVLPVVVWIPVTLRRDDWPLFFGGDARETGDGSTA